MVGVVVHQQHFSSLFLSSLRPVCSKRQPNTELGSFSHAFAVCLDLPPVEFHKNFRHRQPHPEANIRPSNRLGGLKKHSEKLRQQTWLDPHTSIAHRQNRGVSLLS